MKFLLAFDIPTEKRNFKVKINRELNRIGAKLIQRSLWSSSNLNQFIKLAIEIKNVGGSARVLEEKLVFE